MIKKILKVIFVLLISTSCLQANNCYSEYWQKFFWQMYESDPFAIGTYVKIETDNHLKNIRYTQVSEQFAWNVSKKFSLEMNHTYIHSRSIVANSLWKWHYRAELEANRIFYLPYNCLIKTRNRLEIRREQKEPKTTYRLRQRTMLVIPFEGMSILKSYRAYNELFYDISTHYFTQDRICPCQFTLALSNKMDLDIFFLFRVFRANDLWQKSAVLGTQLSF